jgi:hypothetical protein
LPSMKGMRVRLDPAPGDPRGPGRVRPGIGGSPVVFFPLLLWLLNAAAPVQAGVGMPEIGSLQVGFYRAHLLNDSAGLRRGTNTLTVHIPDLPAGDDVTLRLHGPEGELIDVPLRPLRVLNGPAGGHGVATASTGAPAHDSTASAGHAPGQAPEWVVGSDDRARHLNQPAHRETPAGETAPAAHTHAHSQLSHGSDVAGGKPAAAHAPDEATYPGTTQAEAPGDHGTAAHGGAVFSGFVARGAAKLPATGAWRAVLTASDGRGKPLTGELALTVTTDGPNPLFLGFLGLLSGGSVLYGWIRRRRAQSTD